MLKRFIDGMCGLLILVAVAYGFFATFHSARAQVPPVNSGSAAYPSTGNVLPIAAATTVTIGGALLVAGACSTGTVNVAGVTTSMVATVSPVTWPGDGTNITAYVSSNGVVTVKVCAIVALTPASTTYNVRVIQ